MIFSVRKKQFVVYALFNELKKQYFRNFTMQLTNERILSYVKCFYHDLKLVCNRKKCEYCCFYVLKYIYLNVYVSKCLTLYPSFHSYKHNTLCLISPKIIFCNIFHILVLVHVCVKLNYIPFNSLFFITSYEIGISNPFHLSAIESLLFCVNEYLSCYLLKLVLLKFFLFVQ